MSKDIFPQTTADLAATRKKLAPHIHDAVTAFSERVFAEQAVIWAFAPSASIGDSDTHRRYSSLFKRLCDRRLQAVTQRQRTAIERFGANAMQLLECKP